ncbi:MAG: glycoside hydrolase family 28 protein, partial [Asticcacaulis sp.]|nr:glycoside hydrolase family 28 protein [Asticcacaulis sp.]
MPIHFSRRALLGGAAASFLPREAVARSSDSWAPARSILKRIKAPVFPKRDFDIRDHDAVADDTAKTTKAIAAAITACNAAGGGRVVVPAGRWATGAVVLKSKVNLHIADGATLAFSQNRADYPLVLTRFEGVECMNYSPFIYAFGESDIAITGKGTLDGRADKAHWWDWAGHAHDPKFGNAVKTLGDMAAQGIPSEKRIFGGDWKLRPNFIQPYRCRNILIEDVTIVASPMWEIHPVLSRNITVRGVKIDSQGPNNDGCDPESCADVLIENVVFNTGDDCIAIKSGRNHDGRRVGTPSEN